MVQNFCSELGRQFNDLKLCTSFDEVRRFGENGPEGDENGRLAVGAVRSFVSRSPQILGFLEAATGPETVVKGVNGGGREAEIQRSPIPAWPALSPSRLYRPPGATCLKDRHI